MKTEKKKFWTKNIKTLQTGYLASFISIKMIKEFFPQRESSRWVGQ